MELPDQWKQDNRIIQEALWANKDDYLAVLLTHSCAATDYANAQIRHAAWEPRRFIEAALKDRREMLRFTDPS